MKIVGLCFDCIHSCLYNPKIFYWDENNVLHCNAYPDGVPTKVMKSLESTGYCPKKNKDLLPPIE
jgi:hypothetical protein